MGLEATQFSRTGKATVNSWTHIFKIFHETNYPNWSLPSVHYAQEHSLRSLTSGTAVWAQISSFVKGRLSMKYLL